jgi:hypothetical protein
MCIMGAPMRVPGSTLHLATLWDLAWHGDRLACVVYRTEGGMQLRIESAEAVVMTEAFDLQPRALARANALRDALKRRGWQETAR